MSDKKANDTWRDLGGGDDDDQYVDNNGQRADKSGVFLNRKTYLT